MSKKIPSLLIILLFCFVLVHCGSSSDSGSGDGTTGTTGDTTGDSTGGSTGDGTGTSTSTSCSDDGSEDLAVGTYFFELGSGDTQYRMFRSDCSYCSQTLAEDETDADLDTGEWSSTYTDEPVMTITAGGIDYTLDADGQTLTADAFDLTFFKWATPTITCDGEIAD